MEKQAALRKRCWAIVGLLFFVIVATPASGLLLLSHAVRYHEQREFICTSLAVDLEKEAFDANERAQLGVPVAYRPGFPILSPQGWKMIEESMKRDAASERAQAKAHSLKKRFYEKLLRAFGFEACFGTSFVELRRVDGG